MAFTFTLLYKATHTHRNTVIWECLHQINCLYNNQFSSVTQSCLTLCDPWTAACQAFLSFMISWTLLKLMYIELMFIESVMLSSHLILCRPLLHLPSIFLSIWVFFSESVLRIRQPNYWSFTISSSYEYSGLISFRTDWLDLFAVQGTLKSLHQHHSSKHKLFGVQLYSYSNSYIQTWLLEKP